MVLIVELQYNAKIPTDPSVVDLDWPKKNDKVEDNGCKLGEEMSVQLVNYRNIRVEDGGFNRSCKAFFEYEIQAR